MDTHDIHPLEEAILECLDAEDVESALADLRRRHPDHADQIHRVVDRLKSFGAFTKTDERGELRVLGPFRIRERLGEGGMGVVFRAWQEPPGREVALKIIRPELLHFDGTRARFNREVEASIKLSHPGIVPVFEVGTTDGVPWFSMAFVRGASLAAVIGKLAGRDVSALRAVDLEVIVAGDVSAGAVDASSPGEPANGAAGGSAVAEDAQTGAVPPATAPARSRSGESPPGESSSGSTSTGAFLGDWIDASLRIVQGVASALAHAHSRGVLHRDIKPSNVMLSASGHALLLDFGLAHTEDSQRLTRTDGVLGSLPYMPPEVLRGHIANPGPSLDVYSLGVTLYEVLTLRSPFLGPTPEETRRRVLESRPEPPRRLNPRIAKDLQTVCLTAMAEDPLRRYGSVADFARDLDNVRKGAAISASPDTAFDRAARFVRHNRLLVTTTLVILLLVMTGGTISFLLYLEADRQRGISELAAYRAGVVGAALSIRLHRVQRAVDALLGTADSELCGWEWRHLLARVDLSDGILLQRDQPMTRMAVGASYMALSTDTAVIVLDRESARPVREIPAVDTLDLVVTGDRVVWTDGSTLHVAGARQGQIVTFGTGPWNSLGVSPDGEKIVSAGGGGRVALWRIEDRHRLAYRKGLGRREGGNPRIQAVSISADRVACSGPDGPILVLDHELNTLATITDHPGTVEGLAFRPDGKVLASVSGRRAVYLWSAAGEKIGFPLQHDERVLALAFHPTRFELFTAADQGIHRWDVRFGTRLGVVHGHRRRVVGLGWQGPEGPLLSVSEDGTLRRWNPEAEDARRVPVYTKAVAGLAVFPDGARVATVRFGEAGRVISTGTGAILASEALGQGVDVCVDPKGAAIAWLCTDRVQVLDTEDGAPIWSAEVPAGDRGIAAFAPDGKVLAIGGANRTITLLDAETGDRLPVRFADLGGHPVAMRFSADGRRLVVVGEQGLGVRVFSWPSGEELIRLADSAFQAVALDDENGLIAAGGLGGVRVWRMSDFTEAYGMLRHAVNALAFSVEGDRLLTGGTDGVVRVFRHGVEIMRFGSVGAAIRKMEFSADGTTLVTGDDLGQLRVWPAVASGAAADRLSSLRSQQVARPGSPSPAIRLEAESLSWQKPEGGSVRIQESRRYAGDRQVWWSQGQLGDALVCSLPELPAGTYALIAGLTSSFDYGTVRISFNGRVLIDALELRSEQLITAPRSLGTVTLRAGAGDRLRVEIVATPEPLQESRWPNGFGLDYLLLKRVD